MKEGLSPQERNTLFEQMSMEEKRIHVIAEALWLIKADYFKPVKGEYFDSEQLSSKQLPILTHLQQRHNDGVQCKGCAIGSLFAGLLACTNTPVDTETSCNHIKLESLFTKEELHKIEAHFEHWEYGRFNKIIDGKDRAIAILENMLEHKGTFVP